MGIKTETKDGKLEIGYDGDGDGENSVTLKVIVSEAIGEIIAKGKAVEGKAMVDYKIGIDGKLELSLDTDKDGEPSIELEANLGEALSEANLLKFLKK